ncbi:Ig-like domain-containing protein [Clostridium cochlearium]|uniref:Ig domain-containing protein n=1 Tax=Clostridium cochlearium TaxID=1494 RepID=A0A2X2WDS1_CLOCO|nr:Ig-like domain-containing protein [Clostridium cochlearium]SQB34185.1 Ig domain-containing protein [Clostridium cochlearium]
MKNNKKAICLAITAAILSTSVTPAFAKVVGYVTEKDGVLYQYDKTELKSSIIGDGALYAQYNDGKLKALLDDKNGYIDANDVRQYIINEDKIDVDAYTESDKAEKSTITEAEVKKVDKDGNVIEKPVEEGLKVESVSAINATTVKVVFNNAVEKLPEKNVEVVEAEKGNKMFIKEVKLAEDKKSATVELYDSLISGKAYNVSVTLGEETTTKELAFKIEESAVIELKAQTLVGTENKVEYKVLDKNGLDITNLVTVTPNSDKASKFTATEGKVETTLLAGESAFLELSVKTKDGKEVKSDRVKIEKVSSKVAGFGENWTLKSTYGAPVDYKAEDYKQDTIANMESEKYLDFTFVDQFGKDIDKGSATLSYESLDASVAIVDAEKGKVTPRKEGKALLRATLKDGEKTLATKTVEIEVKAKAKATDIKLEKEALEVTKDGNAKVKVTVLDQFGNKIAGDVKVESAHTDVATVTPATGSTEETELTVNGVKAGETTIKVTMGDVEKTISVKVVNAGDLAEYKVKGFVEELFTVKNDDKKQVNEMTLSVVAVDESGLEIPNKPVTGATYTITDAENKEVAKDVAIETKIILDTVKDHKAPYTVSVKVGTLEVFTGEFKVTDNRKAPAYKIKENKLDLNYSADVQLGDTIKGLFDFYEIGSEKLDKITVEKVEFATTNEAVIKNENNDITLGKDGGKATIYLDSVTVKVTEDITDKADKGEYKFDLKGEPINVTVKSEADINAEKALEDAQKAVKALFNGEALADGVNTEAINAAKSKVEALAETVTEKAGLLKDIEKAEGLLAAEELEAAKTLLTDKSVEVAKGSGENTEAVLKAIKALDTEGKNTVIKGLEVSSIKISEGTATVTLAEGVTVTVTVTEAKA